MPAFHQQLHQLAKNRVERRDVMQRILRHQQIERSLREGHAGWLRPNIVDVLKPQRAGMASGKLQFVKARVTTDHVHALLGRLQTKLPTTTSNIDTAPASVLMEP
jgi:hypothetical protein